MAQEQDIMSVFKRLSRINKEGGSMNQEERKFFEQTKEKSDRLGAQVRSNSIAKNSE